MLSEEQVRVLVNKILKLSPARSTEVTITSCNTILIRFAGNRILGTFVDSNTTVSVRAINDDRIGRAVTNRTDEAALSACCEAAFHLAKHAAPDPDVLPLPGPQSYREVTSFYEATHFASPQTLVDQATEMIHYGKSTNASLAGSNRKYSFVHAIGNSQGLFASTSGTNVLASVTALFENNTGYASTSELDIRQIDYEKLTEKAVGKAMMSKDPRELPAGEYVVILEPLAVSSLLALLVEDTLSQVSFFSGTAGSREQSFASQNLGNQVFGELFTLDDDVYHLLQQGIPFDGEGIPRMPVVLVYNGILSALVHSRVSALRVGEEPTGHGLELPNPYGALPEHLIMKGGDISLEEMIANTKRGILVTRLWYNRLIDPNNLSVTGMTRDGTFLIEDGTIVSGVKNLRYNESLFRVFNKIVAVGPTTRVHNNETQRIFVVPPIQVEGFNFTGSTLY